MLASPWPISSWLGSMRCRTVPAMALAMEMASMKPTRAMTRAALNSCSPPSRVKPGRRKDGSPAGIEPTTSPPPMSCSPPWSMRLTRQRRPSVTTSGGAWSS